MKRVIMKFEIEADEVRRDLGKPGHHAFILNLPPPPFMVLAVETQNNRPYMWISVTPDADGTTQPQKFVVIPDGVTYVADGLEYVGMFQLERGGVVLDVYPRPSPLVFHVFLKLELP